MHIDQKEICIQENMSAGDARTSGDWVMEIKNEVEMIESLKKQERDAWKNHSIYKLPQGFVREQKRLQAYEPQVVSLGPYHHGEPQVKAMEEHKRRALRQLLARTNKSLDEFREALKNGRGRVLPLLMDSYKHLDERWRKDEEGFLKMMILDGCFMMEVMKTDETLQQGQQPDYDVNDPIFGRQGMLSNLPRIKRDMLMIENQIPLLVLHKLYAAEKGVTAEQDKYINHLLLYFFSLGAASSRKELGLHVLDVVRKSMLEEPPNAKLKSRARKKGRSSKEVIWPVTELHRAGIGFARSPSGSLTDISFEKGVLRLPKIIVDDATESMFLNLMAFEHLHAGAGNEVSSYVSFMDNIINSERDVTLLSQCEILKNFVGTDKAVAELFNGIALDVSIDPLSHLSSVHQQVTYYCRRSWRRVNKHVVDLGQAYFKSPWTFISLIAAILLLHLSIIQTVYTILQYYKPN